VQLKRLLICLGILVMEGGEHIMSKAAERSRQDCRYCRMEHAVVEEELTVKELKVTTCRDNEGFVTLSTIEANELNSSYQLSIAS
jgi:hypothetical protein